MTGVMVMHGNTVAMRNWCRSKVKRAKDISKEMEAGGRVQWIMINRIDFVQQLVKNVPSGGRKR